MHDFNILEEGESHYVWKPGDRKIRIKTSVEYRQEALLRRVDTYRGSLLSKKGSLLNELLESCGNWEEGPADMLSCVPNQITVTADVEKESGLGEKVLETSEDCSSDRRMVPTLHGEETSFSECVSRAAYYCRRQEIWRRIEEEAVSF